MAVFAFMFGAPAILWGLALAGAPLLIHLLNRQRHKEMHWAAMRWLLQAMRKNARRVQIEQWLLLAIRTLLIICVVAAMSKPIIESAGPLLASTTSATHHVIVFDNSMSMQFASGGRSRWERAKSLAQSVLETAQKGDLASVVVMGSPTSILVGDASPYLSAVGEEVEAIKVHDGIASVEQAMDRVEDILKNSSAGRKQLYLITDMQRTSWQSSDLAGEQAGLAKKLRAMSDRCQFVILDAGGTSEANLSVASVEQIEPVILSGTPTGFRASIVNHSSEDRNGVRVQLLVDGQIEAVETLDLAAGETGAAIFNVRFRETGDQAVEARIEGDDLKPDNHHHYAARVRDALNVLLIEGEPAGGPFESEADYLRVAFEPSDASQGPASIRTETRLESDLLEINLGDWDLVVLCNVGQLTPSEVAVLEEHTRQGGGLLFFLGKQTNIEAFNSVLFNEGKGLLPVRLADLSENKQRDDEAYGFDPLDYVHPVVAPFLDLERAGLLTTKIFRYAKIELPTEEQTSKERPAPSVALAFTTGDPAIVLADRGRGRVGVVATSADLDWNSWAISPSFLPVMRELAGQLVKGRVSAPESRVGDLLSIALPERVFDVSATLTPPGEGVASEPMRPQEGENDANLLEYDRTGRSGIYRVSLGPPIDQTRLLAVNTWPRESVLERVSSEDLRSMFPGWEFTLHDRWPTSGARAQAVIPDRGEIYRPLLYIALFLAFLETFLAWKFGHHRLK
ncbi:hypothetical protein Pan216_08650 [Planctomycetes bacterium Pan216]|uniref:VWFA domain-containing protein n=1 Tax=Kolteria novifilia TaxID=2527975 RepID=A0A518AZ71_9BACT|nr:hypothetical protein Pan216_08650 [Planctomycetes bacterium Pan216]